MYRHWQLETETSRQDGGIKGTNDSMRWIERQWQRDTLASRLLLPLGWLYGAIVRTRRLAYQRGWFTALRVSAPVIVIGNITVGGTGKTPLAIWLTGRLAELGWRPGIVTRGYRGQARHWPQLVTGSSDPDLVGDEPVVLALRTGRPVVADPDRVRGARRLIEQGCDIVISDDGLQHYRLQRDVEIAVTDGERRYGNGRLLPAGPLRESRQRLQQVDVCVVQGGVASPTERSLTLVPVYLRQVAEPRAAVPFEQFQGRTVHAVAGIGHPARFFALLRGLGLDVIEHEFPDHYRFGSADLVFAEPHDVIMTEKDAVKCRGFAGAQVWYLAVEARVDTRLEEWVSRRFREPTFKHPDERSEAK
jgi:tetraacyldisaccharide 4'-kinase